MLNNEIQDLPREELFEIAHSIRKIGQSLIGYVKTYFVKILKNKRVKKKKDTA